MRAPTNKTSKRGASRASEPFLSIDRSLSGLPPWCRRQGFSHASFQRRGAARSSIDSVAFHERNRMAKAKPAVASETKKPAESKKTPAASKPTEAKKAAEAKKSPEPKKSDAPKKAAETQQPVQPPQPAEAEKPKEADPHAAHHPTAPRPPANFPRPTGKARTPFIPRVRPMPRSRGRG
jgi:outer membrane biosynthesis protein TonB